MNGISSVRAAFGCHCANSLMFFSATFFPSQFRSTASSTIRMDTGNFDTAPNPRSLSPKPAANKNDPLLAVAQIKFLQRIKQAYAI